MGGRSVADVHCRYLGEWGATKLRRGLAVDPVEAATLEVFDEACGTTAVTCTSAT